MQLDDHLSTSLERTSPVLHIPDQAIQHACRLLLGKKRVDKDYTDDFILVQVFLAIEYALEKHSETTKPSQIRANSGLMSNASGRKSL
jgi:hypothetical protein